ncbi:hypothetical protein PCE1_000127 [Barthelona sp. PCE]
MHLVCLTMFYRSGNDAHFLGSSKSLNHIGFFQRRAVAQFANFGLRTIAQRAEIGRFTAVRDEAVGHYSCVYINAQGLGVGLICDDEYYNYSENGQATMTICHKVLRTYQKESNFDFRVNEDCESGFTDRLSGFLSEFAEPGSADKLGALRKQLDTTTGIVHDNLSKMMRIGEDLDRLVADTDDLNAVSRGFYTQARRANRCNCRR